MQFTFKGFAPTFCAALLSACGSGGSKNPPVSQQPPPPPPPARIALTATNYQPALKTAFGFSITAFNYVKLSGFIADGLIDVPLFALINVFPCGDSGRTLLQVTDRNSDGVFNVGDAITQVYEHCTNAGTDMDGLIRVELQSSTPKDGGRELSLVTTVVDLRIQTNRPELSPLTINFAGPVLHTRTPEYEQFRVAGATFSTSQPEVDTSLSAVFIDFLQRNDTHVYSFTFAGTIDNELLGGKFDFLTPIPFSGLVGEYPTRGLLGLTGGANSTARLSEEGAAANNDTTVFAGVDSTGDGVTDTSEPNLPWDSVAPKQVFDAFRTFVVVPPASPP